MKKIFKVLFIFVLAFICTNKVKAFQMEINKVDENNQPISDVKLTIEFATWDGKYIDIEPYLLGNLTYIFPEANNKSKLTFSTNGTPIKADMPDYIPNLYLTITEDYVPNKYSAIREEIIIEQDENSTECISNCDSIRIENNKIYIINKEVTTDNTPNELGNIKINKVNEENQKISDVYFLLREQNYTSLDSIKLENVTEKTLSDDKTMISFKTIDETILINDLPEGVYNFYEVSAPEIYETNNNTECDEIDKFYYTNDKYLCPITVFTVKEGKTNNIKTNELVTWNTTDEIITMKNKKIQQQESTTTTTSTIATKIENPKTLDENNKLYIILGIIGLAGIIGLGTKFIKSK